MNNNKRIKQYCMISTFLFLFFLVTSLYLYDKGNDTQQLLNETGAELSTTKTKLDLYMFFFEKEKDENMLLSEKNELLSQEVSSLSTALINAKETSDILKGELIERRELYPFEIIASEVADAHEYDLHTYNCLDYTTDLVETLTAKGYVAVPWVSRVDCESGLFNKTTCNNTNGYHAYTRLDIFIESTTGEIIPLEEYEAYNLVDGMIYGS